MSPEIVSTRSIAWVDDAFDDVETEVVEKKRYDADELSEIVGDARGLFVHSENDFDATVIENAPNLEAIAKPGSGIDNIDIDAATEAGVVVLHTPGMNAVAVAEFTVGATLSHLRGIPAAQDHLEAGGWRSPDWWGGELRGKTIGIVGLGAAGSETAKRFRPFCEEILVYDPYVDDERLEEVGAERAELDGLLTRSDVVSVHVRLTPETEGLIDQRGVDLMKDGAVLVNTSRGAVVDYDAVAAALDAGTLGGAVLDVFHEEPPDPDGPLVGREDVLATPHLAGATTETRRRMLNATAENLAAILDGDAVDRQYVANPDALE
ncbi:hydroxyacid dehydrogenase [Halorubrum sp. CSM-61]|uniref:hydroxyacid dehydrogenase n=1 Tax=Halorubrum sp. CSM-61 TaxID=2485838 RepID=UPI0013DE13BC|nr:hydroxyacid dehydrogenase [Halorubrum sp. CSM-61]